MKRTEFLSSRAQLSVVVEYTHTRVSKVLWVCFSSLYMNKNAAVEPGMCSESMAVVSVPVIFILSGISLCALRLVTTPL